MYPDLAGRLAKSGQLGVESTQEHSAAKLGGLHVLGCFWLLAFGSRDFSQAEKETNPFKAEQIH